MTPACIDCGKPYADFPMDLTLPHEQWRMIHGNESGVLCANCMVARAAALPGAVAMRAQIAFCKPEGEPGTLWLHYKDGSQMPFSEAAAQTIADVLKAYRR